MLGLQRAEKRLLCTENLHGGGRLFGEVEQRAGVGNQTRADELANQGSQVGCDGSHAVLQVVVELNAVLRQRNDLVTQHLNVDDVVHANFSAHGDLRGGLDVVRHFLLQQIRQISRQSVGTEA